MTPLQKKFGDATEFVALTNYHAIKRGERISLGTDDGTRFPLFWNKDKSGTGFISIKDVLPHADALPHTDAFKKHQLIEVSNCPNFSGFVDAHFLADISESNPFCKYPIAAITCDDNAINGFKYARKHSGLVHIEFEGEPYKVSEETGAEIKALLENENE